MCNNTFVNKNKNCSKFEFSKRKYCSNLCYSKSIKVIRDKEMCCICGELFFQKSTKKRTCSFKCGMTLKSKESRTERRCLFCGKIFWFFIKFPRKYCSHKCTSQCPIFRKNQSIIKKGISTKKKGTTKFKSDDERNQAYLLSGRKSYRKHIEKRLIYYRLLSYKRKNIKGSFTKEQWYELIEKNNNKCTICKEEKKLTIDHIIPISKWDIYYEKYKPKYQCNDIENIQPLCKSCNSRKHNKVNF